MDRHKWRKTVKSSTCPKGQTKVTEMTMTRDCEKRGACDNKLEYCDISYTFDVGYVGRILPVLPLIRVDAIMRRSGNDECIIYFISDTHNRYNSPISVRIISS